MAKKRPKYPDQLLQPIVKPNKFVAEEESRRLIFEWKFANLYCLASHLGVDLNADPGDVTVWAYFALRLAENLGPPGFQVVDSVDMLPRGRGRPRGSGIIDRSLLRREIERLRAEDPALSVPLACERLSEAKGGTTEAFKKQNPDSLVTAYYKAVKEPPDSLETACYRAVKELRDRKKATLN